MATDQIMTTKEQQLAEYRQRILEETEYVNLQGIPLPTDRNGCPIYPRVPLDRVYIRLQAIESSQRRKADDEEQSDIREAAGRDALDTLRALGEYQYRNGRVWESDNRPTPVDPATALSIHRRLVILGAPGSGKSTLLRFLARDAAKAIEGPVPIIISLRDFAIAHADDPLLSLREFALQSAARDNLQLREAINEAVKDATVCWLVDALDEARSQAALASGQLRDLPGQLVLTSRPVGYVGVGLEALPHFDVLPLLPNDVSEFLRNWFSIIADAEGEGRDWIDERVRWLGQQLEDRPRINALTRNPLLLTFLVVLARREPREHLPDSRAALYKLFVEELLQSREALRHVEVPIGANQVLTFAGLTGDDARRAILDSFYYLGWALHFIYYGGKPRHLPTWNTIKPIIAAYLRKQWGDKAPNISEDALAFWQQAGMLDIWELHHQKYLAFRHLTFQEFAAARGLFELWRHNKRHTWSFLRPRLHHKNWREPVLLLIGMLDGRNSTNLVKRISAARSPLERILHRDLRLAAAATGENVNVDNHAIQKIILRIWHNWTHDTDNRGELWRETLVSIGQRIIPFLLEALGSKAMRIRGTAVSALGSVGGTQAVDAIIAALNDDAVVVRITATKALGDVVDIRAVDALLVSLRDRVKSVRAAAVKVLGTIGGEQVVSALLVALHDTSKIVRLAAAKALGYIGDERVIDALVAVMHDKHASVRAASMYALAEIGGDSVISRITTVLKDDNNIVREAAVKALGVIGGVKALDALIRCARNEDVVVRIAAIMTLGTFPDQRSVGALLDALHDRSPRIRAAAIKALGVTGDIQSIDALFTILQNDNFPGVREAAVKALGVLGASGDSRVVCILNDMQHDDDLSIRAAAAIALGSNGDGRAVNMLLTALNYDFPRIRVQSAKILGTIGGPHVVSALINSLHDENASVRQAIVKALGDIGDARALNALHAALRDDELFVRWTALTALNICIDRQSVLAVEFREIRDPLLPTPPNKLLRFLANWIYSLSVGVIAVLYNIIATYIVAPFPELKGWQLAVAIFLTITLEGVCRNAIRHQQGE
ncbi:MAG TPA: HEAT repeat domain-containing protein [Armatimonadota bacterium]|nr:HEAT repeat domain-containing protein [Armatimonadota bacterium]